MKPVTYEQERVHFNTAKLRKGGQVFEVIIDLDQAMLFRDGKINDVKEVLRSDKIYFNSQKGEVASINDMEKIFGTLDETKIAIEILRNGEIHLTAEFKNRLREQKRRQIMGIIHNNGVDPRTHAPHPMTRIEAAMDQAKLYIDEFKSAEDQVEDVLKKLREIMPIKFEMKEIELVIPAEYATKNYGSIKNLGKILKDDWSDDGWVGIVEIPGGFEDELYDKVNRLTHGNVRARVIRTR